MTGRAGRMERTKKNDRLTKALDLFPPLTCRFLLGPGGGKEEKGAQVPAI